MKGKEKAPHPFESEIQNELKRKKTIFCSWSGGKDSCLALYKAIQMGYDPKFLFTTVVENADRSRSHNLSRAALQAQAKSLGLPIVFCETSWEDYRNNFIKKISEVKTLHHISAGVFGDIDIEEHKQWVEDVCAKIQCEALLPLWKCERKKIIEEFLALGFKALIVVVDSKKLSAKYLGRMIDFEILEEFANKDVDLCGENGEFHTLVIDGPIFKKPLKMKQSGKPELYSGYWIQDFVIEENKK